VQCDFCGMPDPRWCFIVQAASLTVEMTDGQKVQFNSDPHWAACSPCRYLIDNDLREHLARRADTFLPLEITFTIQHVLFWNAKPVLHGAAHTKEDS
jgi:hypothetical protein